MGGASPERAAPPQPLPSAFVSFSPPTPPRVFSVSRSSWSWTPREVRAPDRCSQGLVLSVSAPVTRGDSEASGGVSFRQSLVDRASRPSVFLLVTCGLVWTSGVQMTSGYKGIVSKLRQDHKDVNIYYYYFLE